MLLFNSYWYLWCNLCNITGNVTDIALFYAFPHSDSSSLVTISIMAQLQIPPVSLVSLIHLDPSQRTSN